jgi:phage gpG-like protein
MAAAGAEFAEFAKHLLTLADAPIAKEMVGALGDIWVERSKVVMGHDTNQLHNRTKVTSVTGSKRNALAVVDADTPYAGFHNYGNRWTAPNRFWNEGHDAAEDAANGVVGARAIGSIERLLVSGGVWNPIWRPRK